jgi:hypothetical protein
VYRTLCRPLGRLFCCQFSKNKIKKIAKKTCIFIVAVLLYISRQQDDNKKIVGADDGEGPPVPIPNTEVKLARAENTWLVTAREIR